MSGHIQFEEDRIEVRGMVHVGDGSYKYVAEVSYINTHGIDPGSEEHITGIEIISYGWDDCNVYSAELLTAAARDARKRFEERT